MMKTNVLRMVLVAGARPNFMKIASLIHAIESMNKSNCLIEYKLVHTGQHYDKNLSDVFFEDLQIPHPEVNLEVGSGTQSFQTGQVMIKFESYLVENPCDMVVVVGDVNSTMACAIVAKKMGIKVAHVEAGLQSNDMSMPEEINRLVTDAITDYYFTTSVDAGLNLCRRGIPKDRIFFVGNTMIDSLIRNTSRFNKPELWEKHGLRQGAYFLLTLHRPSNVDSEEKLERLLATVLSAADNVPVIFPVHPRTRSRIERVVGNWDNLALVEPLRYLHFLYLVQHAQAVVTDSGGIQEETTFLKVPCLTLRENTERPETISEGTNVLLGEDHAAIAKAIKLVKAGKWKAGEIPLLWDGKAGQRIIRRLLNLEHG